MASGERRAGARSSERILAGDVGGTKTNLGLFEAGPPLRLVRLETLSSRAFGTFEEMLAAFLPEGGARVAAAAFGIAGPVRGGVADLTNLAWIVDGERLAKRLGLRSVALLNDLEATAWALETLGPDDVAELLPGAAGASGNQAIIAAGTGLGEATLLREGGRPRPVASEAGHADFAPHTDLEIDLLRWLRARFGRASWERVLSGPGLVNVYEFLRDTGGGEEPSWLGEALATADPAAVIARAALEGRSEVCARALDVFAGAYGAEAGNLALRSLATGGVFLGGGIAPKILAALRGEPFRRGFLEKGRLSAVVEATPVKVIVDEKAALVGAARRAAEDLA
jgi:glucokinase